MMDMKRKRSSFHRAESRFNPEFLPLLAVGGGGGEGRVTMPTRLDFRKRRAGDSHSSPVTFSCVWRFLFTFPVSRHRMLGSRKKRFLCVSHRLLNQ